jgi:hypothetical protein
MSMEDEDDDEVVLLLLLLLLLLMLQMLLLVIAAPRRLDARITCRDTTPLQRVLQCARSGAVAAAVEPIAAEIDGAAPP